MIEFQSDSQVATAETSNHAPRRGALLVIFLTVFIDLLGFGIVLPLLPLYGDQFATDPGGWQIGALMASYSLMQFVFSPVWGGLSDRIGRRPVIMVGIGGSVVFYSLFAWAAMYQSLAGLFAARIGAGICAATIGTAQAYIADVTPPEQRTRGMALIGMAFGLGFTFGPVFALFAIRGSGAGDLGAGPGFAAAGLSFIALLCAIFLLPESLKQRSEPRGEGEGRFSLDAWRGVWRDGPVRRLVLASGVFILAFALFETSLSMLVKGSRDQPDAPFRFSLEQVCLLFAALGFLLAIVQGAIVRPLAKHWPPQKMALTGAAIQLAGYAILIAAVARSSLPVLWVAFAFVGGGFACLQPSLNSLLSRWSDPRRQGRVLGVAQSVSAMSRIVGAGLSIPLLKKAATLPYWTSLGLMAVATGMIWLACRSGKDHAPVNSAEKGPS